MRLDLSDNAFSGNLPPSLGNAVKLKYLWLNDNALTGGIPARTGDNSSYRTGLHNLAELLFHDGLRLYGNQLETAIVLDASPTGDLTEGGEARDTTVSITSIDEGTVWASRFEVFDPTRDGCGASPPPDTCYLATKLWDGKITASKSGSTASPLPVPVTVSPAEHDLSIPKGGYVRDSQSVDFTITPGSDAANTNPPETVTITVTGTGIAGVADTKPKVTAVVINVNDSGPASTDFHNQVVELQHVTADSTACLDVSYGNAANGQDVWTWECNDTDAQKWTFEKRTAGDYKDSYRLVSKLSDGSYCLDNRGEFSTSDRMGIWECVDDTHGTAANQSVTVEASGDGYTLTFVRGSDSAWLTTDRSDSNARGGANQTTVSGTAGSAAIWSIVSD